MPQLQAVVPAGAPPNALLRVCLPDGREVDVHVPEGLRPGNEFTFEVPSDDGEAGASSGRGGGGSVAIATHVGGSSGCGSSEKAASDASTKSVLLVKYEHRHDEGREDKWNKYLAFKFFAKKSCDLTNTSRREYKWLSSFYRLDPRWQIMKYFQEVATKGRPGSLIGTHFVPKTVFRKKADIFTVWRPTSADAIRPMMLGEATGKGIDIKGKSARRGNISGFVPFVQIFEDDHKEEILANLKDYEFVRVFYSDKDARDEARDTLLGIKRVMLLEAAHAIQTLKKFKRGAYVSVDEQDLALRRCVNNEANLRLEVVDKLAHKEFYGVDVSERLFWEAFVMKQDCSRSEESKDWHIDRGSSIYNMNANFRSTRKVAQSEGRRVVVYQKSLNLKEPNPMEPRTLLVAYEENENVLPVVSDFDLFLLGSRRLDFKKSQLSENHAELLKWLVQNIRTLFEEQKLQSNCANFSDVWPDVIREWATKGYYPHMPSYGHCDPLSYKMIERAARRLQRTGCVRHGPECFNLHFPQDIDQEAPQDIDDKKKPNKPYLVICETIHNSNVPWKYVNVHELQELLLERIDDGFTFPLNPKWILCDPGWKRVYDKLMSSNHQDVQDSLNCWYPPETGIREEIERISAENPLKIEPETTIGGVETRQARTRHARRSTSSKQETEREVAIPVVAAEIQEETGKVILDDAESTDVSSFATTPEQAFKTHTKSEEMKFSDPRRQIQKSFDQVAREITEKAGIFTVWRDTTPNEAIKKMMLGVASGKGLDIKTKSATRGNINAYTPAIPIESNKHKNMARRSLSDDRFFRVFYLDQKNQMEALKHLQATKERILHDVCVLNDSHSNASENEMFMGARVCLNNDPKVIVVDDYSNVHGLDISEKLFWEAYIMTQDCSRPKGSEWDVGVESLMSYMEFNFDSLRKKHWLGYAPRDVVMYQVNAGTPMEPRTLVMAYEEHGNARPIVEDFDCLLLGTRGLTYDKKMPEEALAIMQWCMQKYEDILEKQKLTGHSVPWVETWLGYIDADKDFFQKKSATVMRSNFDPTIEKILVNAAERLQDTGCVRHGAECFNFIFPQQLDDQFLVISDSLPGKDPWKYLNVKELQEFLCDKIDEGFTIPLNLMWILFYPGWKIVYDKLLASDNPSIRGSLNCWLPPETGIREGVLNLLAKYGVPGDRLGV